MEALGINLGLLVVQIIAFTIVFLTLAGVGLQAAAEYAGVPKEEDRPGTGGCPGGC